jgi:RNA polymerase sigma factor (sigma-70 family)
MSDSIVYSDVGTTTMAEPRKQSRADSEFRIQNSTFRIDTQDLLPTRESLLSRLKNWEDRESWQDFFDTYWRLIYGIACKAGLSDAEAQDIVQETVISVARKIDGFKYDPSVCSFKTWMLNLTRWRIINQLKRRQREGDRRKNRPPSDESTATVEKIVDPNGFYLEAIWDKEWESNLLAAGLERVKRRVDSEQFQIFDLYCIERWPAEKVARTLGVSVARVYLVKHRVGRLLKREVQSLNKQTG